MRGCPAMRKCPAMRGCPAAEARRLGLEVEVKRFGEG
jgi:hypothetical protein